MLIINEHSKKNLFIFLISIIAVHIFIVDSFIMSPDSFDICTDYKERNLYFDKVKPTISEKKTTLGFELEASKYPPVLTLGGIPILYEQRHGGLLMHAYCSFSNLFEDKRYALSIWFLILKICAFFLFLFTVRIYYNNEFMLYSGALILLHPFFHYGFMSDIVELFSMISVLLYLILLKHKRNLWAYFILGLSIYIRVNTLWYFPFILVFMDPVAIYRSIRLKEVIAFLVPIILYASIIDVDDTFYVRTSNWDFLVPNFFKSFKYFFVPDYWLSHYYDLKKVNLLGPFFLFVATLFALYANYKKRVLIPKHSIRVFISMLLMVIVCIVATRKSYVWTYIAFMIFPMSMIFSNLKRKSFLYVFALFGLFFTGHIYSRSKMTLQSQYSYDTFVKLDNELKLINGKTIYLASKNLSSSLSYVGKNHYVSIFDVYQNSTFKDISSPLKGVEEGVLVILDNNYTSTVFHKKEQMINEKELRLDFSRNGFLVNKVRKLTYAAKGDFFLVYFSRN